MAKNKIQVIEGAYPVSVYSAIYKDNTSTTLTTDLEQIRQSSNNALSQAQNASSQVGRLNSEISSLNVRVTNLERSGGSSGGGFIPPPPPITGGNKWSGKSWLVIGDSITAGDGQTFPEMIGAAKGYQQHVAEQTGLRIFKDAQNGQSAGNYYKINSGKDYSPFDVVTILLGANLFESGGLGTVSTVGSMTFNTNTFCGAYQSIIERILKTNPDCYLILVTPIPYFFNDGKQKIDLVRKLDEIAELYSLPKCDFFRNSGVNKLNYTHYYRDTIHPNNNGYKRMGDYLANFIKQL